MPDTSALYTTVRNTSGATAKLGFIPPHGKKLANNADVTVFGDIWDRMTKGGRLNERARASFEAALLAGDIEIVQSPALLLQDLSTVAVKQVSVTGGTLGVSDPSWGSYSP